MKTNKMKETFKSISNRFGQMDKKTKVMIWTGSALGVSGIVGGTTAGVVLSVKKPTNLSENSKSVNENPHDSKTVQEFLKEYPGTISEDLKIKSNSFRGRKDLPDNFAIPNGVVGIEDHAFYQAKLPTLFAIPESVNQIGNFAFWGAEINDGFKLPSSIGAIGDFAFQHIHFSTGFTIPKTVKSIGLGAFDAAKNDNHWTSDYASEVESPLVGGHDYKIINDSESIEQFKNEYPGSIGSNNEIVQDAFTNKSSFTKGFSIPQGIKKIESNAFELSNLPNSFKLPQSLIEIGDNAFGGSTFPANFEIPSSVVTIGGGAFQGSKLPIGFTIPMTVKNIGKDAFKNVNLPDGYYWTMYGSRVPAIDGGGHAYKVLTDSYELAEFKKAFPGAVGPNNEILGSEKGPVLGWGAKTKFPETLPEGITAIGQATFARVDQNLPSTFRIPSTVRKIGMVAFIAQTLPSGFRLPQNLQLIDERAFANTILPKGFNLPTSITKYSNFEFMQANFPEDFTFPPTVTEISNNAFYGAYTPKGFTIPKTVITIKYGFGDLRIPTGYHLEKDGIKVDEVTDGGHEYKVVKDTP